jgi:hypothetical protein
MLLGGEVLLARGVQFEQPALVEKAKAALTR